MVKQNIFNFKFIYCYPDFEKLLLFKIKQQTKKIMLTYAQFSSFKNIDKNRRKK